MRIFSSTLAVVMRQLSESPGAGEITKMRIFKKKMKHGKSLNVLFGRGSGFRIFLISSKLPRSWLLVLSPWLESTLVFNFSQSVVYYGCNNFVLSALNMTGEEKTHFCWWNSIYFMGERDNRTWRFQTLHEHRMKWRRREKLPSGFELIKIFFFRSHSLKFRAQALTGMKNFWYLRLEECDKEFKYEFQHFEIWILKFL